MGSDANLCSVSFTDRSGVRYSIQVTAGSLYEAAILGIHLISQQWAEEPALRAPIRVDTEETTLQQLRAWIHEHPATPEKETLKWKLAEMTG